MNQGSRNLSMGIVLGLVLLLHGHDSHAWRPYDKAIQKKVANDPMVKKYVKVRPLGHGNYGFFSKFKDDRLNRMTQQCRGGFFGCAEGWKVFRGKGRPGLAQFFADALRVAPWRKDGKWVFKLNTGYPRSGTLATEAIALFRHKQAADLLAKTIDSQSKLSYLLCRGKFQPYVSLWRLGAKHKLDVMIKGLTNHRCTTRHVRELLHRLDAWTLSKAQKKKVLDLCVETIFPSAESRLQQSVPACAQYLGRVGTKNSDALEFHVKFSGGGGTPSAFAARRALGNLSHRGSKKVFRAALKSSFRKRQRSARVGRRVRRFTIQTWAENQKNVSQGVALAAMGDRYAKKALRYWVGFLRDGSFHNTSAWTYAFNEAAFASPKGWKRIRSILAKAFKKGVKLLRKKPNHKRYITQAAINLLQHGDKSALKYVMNVIGGNDMHEIQEVLSGCGSTLGQDAGTRWGPRHLRVGKGGLSVKTAQKLVKLIRRKFKFWGSRHLKAHAIRAVLEIEARITAVKKRL